MAGYFSKTDFTPSTSNTYTVSFWVKINNFAPTSTNVPYLWSISDSDTSGLFFQADQTPYNITFFRNNGSTRYSPTNYMRDINAWYHIHLKVSSGTGTLYYNGESVKTSITVDAQNYNGGGAEHYIHTYGSATSTYDNLECIMSHFHFVDGTAYEPTVFGSTDSTTGEWKINTNPSVTYGTNGYFILKDGNTGTDHSGNGNNFTLTGTCTKTEDCPSNVFATWNPLYKNNSTFSNGNTTSASGSSGEFNSASTLGMSSGKWYMEFKRVSGNYPIFGIVDDIALAEYSNANMGLGKTGTTKSIALRLNDGKTRVNNVMSTQGGSISNGDIVGVAVDKTTNKIYFSKNGQWSNGSGAWDSTTFNASTGATDVSSILTGGTWFFACGTDTGEASVTFSANFGNGYFGTTAVSSAGTNASGIGIFEYDVPNGFTALSTKGLNL